MRRYRRAALQFQPVTDGSKARQSDKTRQFYFQVDRIFYGHVGPEMTFSAFSERILSQARGGSLSPWMA